MYLMRQIHGLSLVRTAIRFELAKSASDAQNFDRGNGLPASLLSPMPDDSVPWNAGLSITHCFNQFSPAKICESGLHGAFGKAGFIREHA
jgi:hypothetical protein